MHLNETLRCRREQFLRLKLHIPSFLNVDLYYDMDCEHIIYILVKQSKNNLNC